jgi:type II secretory pathway pseudopilin PulG
MTLVEILIAVGIMSLGMIGIAALFHLAVRNITTAGHRTIAAAVVQNALSSMRTCSLDLSVAPDQYATITIGVGDTRDLKGQPTDSLAWILAYYHEQKAPTPGGGIGHGHYLDTFQIPRVGVVTLPPNLNGQSNKYVACPWDKDYGWTATIRPTPIDEDGDGVADEDPPDGVDNDGDWQTDEDGPNVSRQTVWQVQVAAWRLYRLTAGTGAVSATFHRDSRTVDIVGESADFWNRVKTGDFIRHRRYGVWYRIAGLNPSLDQVRLVEPFTHPFADLSGPADFASRFHLISVCDSTIGP